MKATLTPAPVMPSERAVGWAGSWESAPIVCSACGSSWTCPGAAQAPGSAVAPDDAGPLEGPPRGFASGIRASGMTSETAGLDCRRVS